MSLFRAIRLYHVTLASLSALAVVSAEAELIHAWLGYGVAAVIALRVGWGVVGPRQLGIARFFPSLAEVKAVRWIDHPAVGKTALLGLILNLTVATGTGLLIGPESDERRAGPIAAYADDDERRGGKEEGGDGLLGELHEMTGNLVLVFAGLHGGYLLLFRRKLARAMWFRDKTRPAPGA